MFGLFKKKTPPPTPYDMLFCDVPLEHWKPAEGVPVTGTWETLDEARAALKRKDKPRAQELLGRLLADNHLESRQCLQAWHVLRELRVQPSAADSKHVLGVVLEVALEQGNDTLAAYRDYSARFMSHSGKQIVWEARDPQIDAHIDELLNAGRQVAEKIGPWNEPRRAAPTNGNVRVNLLTPSGLHVVEGQFGALARSPVGGPVVTHGAKLMGALIGRAS